MQGRSKRNILVFSAFVVSMMLARGAFANLVTIDATFTNLDLHSCGGIQTYLLHPGDSMTVGGTIVYSGSGVALGMGQPGLGYIAPSNPFTCTASGGMNDAGPGNSDGSKICERGFADAGANVWTGTASYNINADSDAANGCYLFGLTSVQASAIMEEQFYITVCNPNSCTGKCGGQDGCGGTCPDLCASGQYCTSAYVCEGISGDISIDKTSCVAPCTVNVSWITNSQHGHSWVSRSGPDGTFTNPDATAPTGSTQQTLTQAGSYTYYLRGYDRGNSLTGDLDSVTVAVSAGCQGCQIGATCYQSNAKNPSNECQICMPAYSNVGWSNASGSCSDDGNPCSQDVCSNGTCAHGTPVSGSHFECSSNVCASMPNSVSACGNQNGCSSAGGACGCAANYGQQCPNTNTNCGGGAYNCAGICNGQNCTASGRTCSNGACVSSCAGCQIGGTCYAEGAACPDDGNPCSQDVCSNGTCAHGTPVSGSHFECSSNVCASMPNSVSACGNQNGCSSAGGACGCAANAGQACGCNNGGTISCAGYCSIPACTPTPGPTCVPNCTGKQCGDDNCGGLCGQCAVSGETCGGGGTPNVCGAPPAPAPSSQPHIILGHASLTNLLNAGSVKEFLSSLIDFLIFIGLIAAGFLIVYAGIRMMLSAGNESQLTAAKSVLTWAVVGFIILLLARAFMQVIWNFVGTGSPTGAGGGGGGACQGIDCSSYSAQQCASQSACCQWSSQGACVASGGGGGSTNPTPTPANQPGSAPMLFVDLTISGEGSGASVSAAAAPFDGFYTSPVLDDGEFLAKLLDGNGQLLFVHGFNGSHLMSDDIADASGEMDLALSGGRVVSSLNTAIIIPAVSGAQTLEITDAAGAPLAQTAVAAAVSESIKKFARKSETREIFPVARAAGGVWRIAVIGANYPSKASFDSDWHAFESRLRSTSPYSTLGGAIAITPIYKSSSTAIFTPGELGCVTNSVCRGYWCPRVQLAANSAALASYDNVIAFVGNSGQEPGGCSDVDANKGNMRFATVNSNGDPDKAGRTGVHELSHAFGALLDEYLYASSDSQLAAKWIPMVNGNFNCEQYSSCPRWSGTAGTSCIKGCLTNNHYRSVSNSLMTTAMWHDPFWYGPYDELLIKQQLNKFGIVALPAPDAQPPTASITAPKDNSVLSGNYPIWAVAIDNVGVTRVEFYVDGNLIGAGTRGSDTKTFSMAWNTAGVADGTHLLQAAAYDAAGNKGQSPIFKAIVSNASPLLKINTTRFATTDSFDLVISGAPPNTMVDFKWWKNGASFAASTCPAGQWCPIGSPTLADGTWTMHGTFDANLIGSWKEQARIGTAITNDITFSISAVSGGTGPCDTVGGLQVVCIQKGDSYAANGTITYGGGFPSGMPAMGMGAVMGAGGAKLGYLPLAYPFTCTASGGSNSISVSNVASGKICEAIFDNASPGTGAATYSITADSNAPSGDYLFGLNANSGATITEPNFYLRIQ